MQSLFEGTWHLDYKQGDRQKGIAKDKCVYVVYDEDDIVLRSV